MLARVMASWYLSDALCASSCKKGSTRTNKAEGCEQHASGRILIVRTNAPQAAWAIWTASPSTQPAHPAQDKQTIRVSSGPENKSR
jgi:hypothetical protein